MTVLTVTSTARPAGLPPAYRPPKTPPMRLIGSRGSKITVPFAPLPVSHDGLATAWQHLERPLRDPLSVLGDNPTRTMRFTLTFAYPSRRRSAEPWIRALQKIGKSGEAFTVSYGPTEAGLWNIDSLSIVITDRLPNNDAMRFTADLQLAAADAVARLGPMSGGAGGARPIVGPAPVTAGAPRGTGSAAPPRGALPRPPHPRAASTYVVRAGDSLSAISMRMFGSTVFWRPIADYNRLPNANLLRPGQVLKIPAL